MSKFVSAFNDFMNMIFENAISSFDSEADDDFKNHVTHSYDAGDGIKIYEVDESKEAQLAIRKALDETWRS